MSWLPQLVTFLSGTCFLTNLLDIPNPVCSAADSANTAQIIRALTAAPAPIMANGVNIKSPSPLGLQLPQESALSRALSILASQPTPGLAELSDAELERYIAGLDAPEPTTMLTVATSTPTVQSSS